MAIYFVGLIALMAILVVRAPWFGFFAFTGYLHAFRVLHGRWRLLCVAAVAVIAATSQYGGFPALSPGGLASFAIFVTINVLVAGAGAWFALVSEQQNERRKEALAALEAANRQLEDTMRENAALHAQLLTQAREAGVHDERARMAREIHDTLAQGFTAIIAQLEAAKRADEHALRWQDHVDRAEHMARDSLVEARRSVQALRPELLEHRRLHEALAKMTEEWSRRAAVPHTLEIVGEPRALLPDIEATLFRVAQEALANVAKHSKATRVGVTLSYLDEEVLLDVRDDGVGFVPPAQRPNGHSSAAQGFGLSSMRQRVAQAQGTLVIESAPGDGAAINVSIPTLAVGGAP
jgi:signal transduction histidine kinase